MQTPTASLSPSPALPGDTTDSPPEKPPKIAKTEHQKEEEDQKLMTPQNPNSRIQRYLFAVEYIGTRFSGSQKQLESCRTVVGVLEEAFHKFIGQPVTVSISSRTDAGVHALSNVCHVDVERISKRKPGEVLPAHEPGVVRRAVNHFLQRNDGDIMVTDVRCVPSDFHARFRAQERTYFYRLLSGPDPLSTFEKDRAWHVPEELDLVSMQKACEVLVGSHDFSSFRAAGCQISYLRTISFDNAYYMLLSEAVLNILPRCLNRANSPLRTLDELNVTEVLSTPYFPSITERGQSICLEQDLGAKGFGQRKNHRCFVITARARSFLYHQVRLLVGVIKCAGTGTLTSDDVERILNAKNISAASPMAPACGLYLGNVKYELP